MDCGCANWTLMRHDQVQMQMTANETSTTHPGRLPFPDFLRTCNYAPNKSMLSFPITDISHALCIHIMPERLKRQGGTGLRLRDTEPEHAHKRAENCS